mmetsp:Transcript_83411/g.223179  ORF Transcript_83411/g.223179 Transcript_83411/m.223179 type:complete len:260 (+) Transcript_83411:781-1560(+)
MQKPRAIAGVVEDIRIHIQRDVSAARDDPHAEADHLLAPLVLHRVHELPVGAPRGEALHAQYHRKRRRPQLGQDPGRRLQESVQTHVRVPLSQAGRVRNERFAGDIGDLLRSLPHNHHRPASPSRLRPVPPGARTPSPHHRALRPQRHLRHRTYRRRLSDWSGSYDRGGHPRRGSHPGGAGLPSDYLTRRRRQRHRPESPRRRRRGRRPALERGRVRAPRRGGGSARPRPELGRPGLGQDRPLGRVDHPPGDGRRERPG